MRNIDTYDQERARRARIQAEYEQKVKGQLFQTGTNKDNLTGFSTPQDKPLKRAVMQSVKINLK